MMYKIEARLSTMIVTEPISMRDISQALRFKAEFPKAKAPAEMWTAFADRIDKSIDWSEQ